MSVHRGRVNAYASHYGWAFMFPWVWESHWIKALSTLQSMIELKRVLNYSFDNVGLRLPRCRLRETLRYSSKKKSILKTIQCEIRGKKSVQKKKVKGLKPTQMSTTREYRYAQLNVSCMRGGRIYWLGLKLNRVRAHEGVSIERSKSLTFLSSINTNTTKY